MVLLKLKRSAARLFVFCVAAAGLVTGALALTPETLVPVGQAVGISVKTQGVLVSELSEFEMDGVSFAPARDAGLLPGDIITQIGERAVNSGQDMMEALDMAPEEVTVRFFRGGEERQVTVRPYRDESGTYLGVWIKDGVTGIGTVTWYDPESGTYGALGHSIADSATGLIVPIREGSIMPAQVTGVTKSRSGSPGQLGGTFDYSETLGTVDKNCGVGIFGKAGGCFEGEALPVAERSEVKPGKAAILCDVCGERRKYEIEITRVWSDSTDGRDMMLHVTDQELLDLTGGIVQGMSGSPILQDGKLVGAVTHVLINDPEKGYGVFVENMVNEMN